MVDDALIESVKELLYRPSSSKLQEVRRYLRKAYREDPEFKGKCVISQMIYNQMDERTDLEGTVKNYFTVSDKESVDAVLSMIRDIRKR